MHPTTGGLHRVLVNCAPPPLVTHKHLNSYSCKPPPPSPPPAPSFSYCYWRAKQNRDSGREGSIREQTKDVKNLQLCDFFNSRLWYSSPKDNSDLTSASFLIVLLYSCGANPLVYVPTYKCMRVACERG
jgi:hypothetical protein